MQHRGPAIAFLAGAATLAVAGCVTNHGPGPTASARQASPSPESVVIRDLSPRFLTFYDSATMVALDEPSRWLMWKRLYGFAAVPPTAFGDSLARRLLDSAWTRYPDSLARIRKGVAAFGVNPDIELRRVVSLLGCGQNTRVRLIAFVGGFDQNAFAFSDSAGVPVVAIPIESGDALRSMVHEFTHAVHRSSGCADIRSGYGQSVGELAMSEGIAMRVVQALVPGHPEPYYLAASEEWLDAARSRREAILKGIRDHVADSGDASVQRFTFGEGTTGLRREAYYAGWEIVGELLRGGMSFHDIATTPPSRFPALIDRAIASLEASIPQMKTSTRNDSVIQKIWVEARDKSQLYPLAQALLDSIGPRLTGSAEQRQANEWALAIYRKLGVPVRAEKYGTWMGWRRGIGHIDLIAPRSRPLEGMLSTWSPGTTGSVEGPVVLFPKVQSAAEFEAKLPQLRGKFVLLSFPWPSCRPDENWKEFATPESFERMKKERADAFDAWYTGRVRKSGLRGQALVRRLEESGALGIVTVLVPPPGPQGWGVLKISTTIAEKIPELGLSCEDYGLVFRLAENNQGPVLRVNADAQFTGEVPVSNVIAELRGREKPNEYVVLSGHFDSWDPASGATDNGSATVMIMEAMRILKAVDPNPRRTILAAHWSGEEQGLNGSGSFAADHPEVLSGLQILLNQDSGTGRVDRISMQGFTGAGAFFRRWLAQIPNAISDQISLVEPGTQERGTDHFSFACHGAPAFELGSVGWDYEAYTWHTNRDTFDKLVFDDLKSNAALVAMLAYLASEDSQRVPRERVSATDPKTDQPTALPRCIPPLRNWAQYEH